MKSLFLAAVTTALLAPAAASASITLDTAAFNTSKSTCYSPSGSTITCSTALSGTSGNSLIVKANEDATLQVKITAWQANQSGGAISSAFLGTYAGGGLGVTGAGDTSGGTAGGAGTHQIDNVGGYTDFIMLQFSRAVRMDSVATNLYTLAGASPKDSDFSWFNADGVIVPPTWNASVNLAGYTNSPSLWTNVAGADANSSRGLGAPSTMFSSVWLISAAQLPTSDLDDGFKLSQILVTPRAIATPEPATWAMMILGFGGIGASLRRRVRYAAGATLAA